MAKNFLIIPNLKKEKCTSAIKETCEFLKKAECEVFCLEENKTILSAFGIEAIKISDIQKIDIALVFGGDGTFLDGAKKIGFNKIPMMGINLGHLGYLSEVEPSDFIPALKRLVEDAYETEERIALEVLTESGKRYSGFNEAILHRGSLAHILNISVDINGQRIEKIRADGIMVSTPTGSTAYNLSAGGPIILPSAKSLVITPICAHSLAVRSIVVGKDDEIKLSVEKIRDDGNAALTIDGENISGINEKEALMIKASEYALILIKTKKYSFYQTLQKKLNNTDFD